MRVLFISTSIPPYPESQTIRNLYFLRGMAERGIEITVVTRECENGDESMLSLMPEATVIRTKEPVLYEKVVSFLKKWPYAKRLQWLFGVYSSFFMIPDTHKGWDKIVINHLREHELKHKPDLIVASSGSFTAQLAAVRLAEQYGVPYVAEIGDPWTYNPIWPATFFYRRWRNKKLELRSIPKSDVLIVTTKSTAELYRNWLKDKINRIEVVTMGYSKNEFDGVQLSNSHIIKVSYIGVAYRTARNIMPIIHGTASIVATNNNIRFQVVGPYSASYETEVKAAGYRFVDFVGRVSYADSIDYIRDSEILVIIGNTGGIQIPGKVFMYLASGRPILYVSQDNSGNDPTWDLLKGFNGVRFSTNHTEDIAASIGEMVTNYSQLAEEAIARVNTQALRSLEWEEIGTQFADVILSAATVPKNNTN